MEMRKQTAKIIKLHILFSLHINICCMFTNPRISLKNVAAACAYMILLFMLALAFAWLSLYLHSKLVAASRKVAELLGLIRTLCSYACLISTMVFCMRHQISAPWLDQYFVLICLLAFNNCILHETQKSAPLLDVSLVFHM